MGSHFHRICPVLALSVLLLACEGTVKNEQEGAGGQGGGSGGAGGSAGAGNSGGNGGNGGSAGAGGMAIACDPALVQAIAQETSLVGSCTATVRLDYMTLTPKGFAIICGKYAQVTENDARQRALMDAGSDTVDTLISGSSPEDEFVFRKSPGDFGGAAAVSARNGLTVFGGTIVWDGAGMVSHPKTWRDPSELGFGCSTPNIALPTMRSFDLTGMQFSPEGPSGKDALDVVWHSALPQGLMQSGYIFDAVTLLYPRSVGAFDPSTAEWVVLVNGGWLE